MPEGRIVKALSGYYYVQPDGEASGSVQCRGRGILKKKELSPLVGDRVVYSVTENGEGMVDDILPRASELVRPPIANVDLVVLVFACEEPALNLLLLDKFLVHAENAGLDTVICLTKCDLIADPEQVVIEKENMSLDSVIRLYEQIGYEMIQTSSRKRIGVDAIMARLAGHLSVFAGQSGVGKSSLLNAMVPGLELQTNLISSRLGRGKHTTRHVELIRLDNGAVIADTPGFSQLDFLQLEVEELGSCFKEFNEYAPHCKFRGCSHMQEPGCKVIEAVENGQIALSRYEHYLIFMSEMKDAKRRY